MNIREGLNNSFKEDVYLFGKDYKTISDDDKTKLGALVNNTLALSAMLKKTIE